jgi:hypothetical protein
VDDHAVDAGSEQPNVTVLATAHATTPCSDACLARMPEIDTVASDTTLDLGCQRLGNLRG